eukprot:403351033
MASIVDTANLMSNFLQMNEKLKNLIGENLPQKEKRSKVIQSQEISSSGREKEREQMLASSQFREENFKIIQRDDILTTHVNENFFSFTQDDNIEQKPQSKQNNIFMASNFDLSRIVKSESINHTPEKPQENAKQPSFNGLMKNFGMNANPDPFIQDKEGYEIIDDSIDEDQNSSQLMSSQDMSRILDTTFNQTATMINQQINQNKPCPKSPVFKQSKKQLYKLPGQAQAFTFELREVRECLNHNLEESQIMNDDLSGLNKIEKTNSNYLVDKSSTGKNSDEFESLYMNIRKKINLETALMEQQSVVSDSIDIKSNKSDYDQMINNATPFSDKFAIQENTEKDIELMIDQTLSKFKSEIKQQVSNNSFDLVSLEQSFSDMKNELSAQVKCILNELQIPSSKFDVRNRAFKDQKNKKATTMKTANPSYELKSETSSVYKQSVAALSAQPYTVTCNNCRRRISSNNLLMPQKGSLNINPFCIPNEAGGGLGFKQKSLQIISQNLQRMMNKGPNLDCNTLLNNLANQVRSNNSPYKQEEKCHQIDSSKKLIFQGLIDDIKYVNQEIQNDQDMNDFGNIPRKRSISFNKDHHSRSQSMAEDEILPDLKETNSNNDSSTLKQSLNSLLLN